MPLSPFFPLLSCIAFSRSAPFFFVLFCFCLCSFILFIFFMRLLAGICLKAFGASTATQNKKKYK